MKLTEVNNSYYFEGGLSLEISFSLRLFSGQRDEAGTHQQITASDLNRLESCEIKETGVRD